MELKRATRKQVKLKLNISSPSGAGKTMGALLMAKGLVGEWNKVGVIDTENSSASLYSHLGDFLTLDLSAPFTPERYIEAINTCIKAGIECIIIDSSTHEWSGSGGCIEFNEKIAQAKFKGNTWSAWSETTPKHDRFVNTVLQAPVHVITCTRSKMETVMGEDKRVKKLGMKDMQRDGWEYELTVSLTIDRDTHMAIASKDRTNIFEKKDPFIITEETGKLIKTWCDMGVVPEPSAPVITDPPAVVADRTIKVLSVDEACQLLLDSATLDQLKANWKTIGKTFQSNEYCANAKEKVKAELTKAVSAAPAPKANAKEKVKAEAHAPIDNWSHACNKLKLAKSLDELKEFWALIIPAVQAHPAVEDEKNAMKQSLTKAPAGLPF